MKTHKTPWALTIVLALLLALALWGIAWLLLHALSNPHQGPELLTTSEAFKVSLYRSPEANPRSPDLHVQFYDVDQDEFDFRSARENGFYFITPLSNEEISIQTSSPRLLSELSQMGKIKSVLFLPDENGQFIAFDLEDEFGTKTLFTLSEGEQISFVSSYYRVPFEVIEPAH